MEIYCGFGTLVAAEQHMMALADLSRRSGTVDLPAPRHAQCGGDAPVVRLQNREEILLVAEHVGVPLGDQALDEGS